MSGHSKWATTKRHKAVIDAKRSAVFTKIANLITIAAREKGGDPSANFSLRMAIDKGRAVNMPKENIERAIKRGAGGAGGVQIEEVIYEGIGPVKSQFILKCLTDNRNRTASEVRHLFSEYGGALGAVMWNFSRQGVIEIVKEELQAKNLKNEEFELELIDAGAEDLEKEEEGWTIFTKAEDLMKVKNFLDVKNIATESADIEFVAKEKTKLKNLEDQEKIEKFINTLEESEDVGDYYTNVIA
jgi:YebC/PmpR family DNA-binding regulatory protein